jgi:hypothetical protein
LNENAPEAERFRDLKKEVDEGFDEALAEVTAALAAVPAAVAVPLPGFEPAGQDPGIDPLPQPQRAPATGPSPLQEQLDLSSSDADEVADDPITAFAPISSIDWGPRRPTLKRRSEDDPGAEDA